MNIISPSAKNSHCLGEIKLFRVTTYFGIILVIQCTLEPMYIPVFDEGHSLKFYRSQFTNRLYILGYRSSCLGWWTPGSSRVANRLKTAEAKLVIRLAYIRRTYSEKNLSVRLISPGWTDDAFCFVYLYVRSFAATFNAWSSSIFFS